MSDQCFFSVLIVNYNGGTYLQGALKSLAAQSFRSFEVILVDNASSDGSMEGLDFSGLPEVRVEMSPENLGFAGGNNLAAGFTKGEWLVLLNADALARPDWLEVLHREIVATPDCAMFASTQLSMDDPETLDGVGDAYLGYGFAWRGGYRRPASEIPEKGEVFGPCGASAAYRRDAFEAAGGFDESFFCFMEDVDLAFKMRLQGEYCLFLPDAIIEHKGGGLSGEKSEFAVFHGSRNRIWTWVGNMPTGLLIATIPGHLVLLAYVLLHNLFSSYGKSARQGSWAGLKTAFQVRRARKSLRQERKVSSADLIRMFHWNPVQMSLHKAGVKPIRASSE